MIVGDNVPSPVGIGLTDLSNIGGASGPPAPPSSGITAYVLYKFYFQILVSSKDSEFKIELIGLSNNYCF